MTNVHNNAIGMNEFSILINYNLKCVSFKILFLIMKLIANVCKKN